MQTSMIMDQLPSSHHQPRETTLTSYHGLISVFRIRVHLRRRSRLRLEQLGLMCTIGVHLLLYLCRIGFVRYFVASETTAP